MRFLHSNPPLSLLVATTFIISSTTLSVSAAAAPVVEMNFLRHRNLQESSTSPTTVAQCEPCPVCDAASITPEAKKEKIKLRFLVADRSFAQLKVMLDQVADDYTRKVRHGVTTLLFLSMGISLVGVCCMVHDREMNTLIV